MGHAEFGTVSTGQCARGDPAGSPLRDAHPARATSPWSPPPRARCSQVATAYTEVSATSDEERARDPVTGSRAVSQRITTRRPRYHDRVNEFDADAMIARFRERAEAVRRRGLPPVEGPDRQRFLQAATVDFQDFAMLADATATLDDGILRLEIDLRPRPTSEPN